IANMKHKLLYPNYKYTPIRDKNKKSRKSNNTYKQHPSLVANDIVKSTKIESNKKFEPLQIQETNNIQASTDNNNCQNNSTSPNLSIEPISESYLLSSFLPNYLSHEYRQNILAPSMMPVQFTNNLNPYYLQCYQPQGYFIFNSLIDPVLINENGFNTSFSNFRN
ncbi:4755_t:CDS:1, partial [Dentiscutata heterogama]